MTSPIHNQGKDDKPQVAPVDKNKPTGDPRAKKNFRKLLDDVDADKRQEAEMAGAEEAKEETPSLFDLAGRRKLNDAKKQTFLKDGQIATQEDEQNQELLVRKNNYEIPSGTPDEGKMLADAEEQTLLRNAVDPSVGENKMAREKSSFLAAAARQANMTRSEVMGSQEDSATLTSSKTKKAKSDDETKSSVKSDFLNESSDMASLTAAGQIKVDTRYFEGKQEITAQKSDIESLIQKIVDNIKTIESQNEHQTIVDLNYPPGAVLTLRTENPLTKQYHIAFTELSPEAMSMLSAQKATLVKALEDQKFVINTFTLTEKGLPDISIKTEAEGQQYARRDDQGQQQNPQQQKRG